MKLTQEQLKQIILEELSELMYEETDESKMYSFLMRDSNELINKLKTLMPTRKPTSAPELAPYKDYLYSFQTRRQGYGQLIEPPVSENDLVYQPELRKEILQALNNFKDKFNDPQILAVDEMLQNLKSLMKSKQAENRELFFSDNKYDIPNVNTIMMGLKTQANELELQAQMIEKILFLKKRYDAVLEKNIQSMESVGSLAAELGF
tara:strand:- start:2121 stop:2738 length:618 start_codon:yes stop_codon:yes gene_type:complete